MPLTRDFRETVKARAERDPAFRAGLVQEALQAIVEGDLPTARVLLRDAINATVGFKRLGENLHVGEKSLMRMYGPRGNPRADNLLATLVQLRDATGVSVQVKASPAAGRRNVRGRALRLSSAGGADVKPWQVIPATSDGASTSAAARQAGRSKVTPKKLRPGF